MSELEKIAFVQLQTQLYDCNQRIYEVQKKIEEMEKLDEYKNGKLGFVSQPLYFIKSSCEKVIKISKAFDV